MKKTLKELLIEAGYPASEMFSCGTSLYVYKNDLTTEVVKQWLSDGESCLLPITVFRDNESGCDMYSLPFQWQV